MKQKGDVIRWEKIMPDSLMPDDVRERWEREEADENSEYTDELEVTGMKNCLEACLRHLKEELGGLIYIEERMANIARGVTDELLGEEKT